MVVEISIPRQFQNNDMEFVYVYLQNQQVVERWCFHVFSLFRRNKGRGGAVHVHILLIQFAQQ